MKDDPEVWEAILAQTRQEDTEINLIASENTSSRSCREAAGSVLMNKYAEGYPGKRWYSGCLPVDAAEAFAQDSLDAAAGNGASDLFCDSQTDAVDTLILRMCLLQLGCGIVAQTVDDDVFCDRLHPACVGLLIQVIFTDGSILHTVCVRQRSVL
jgi:glycine/serine hydroxymethyltransferase